MAGVWRKTRPGQRGRAMLTDALLLQLGYNATLVTLGAALLGAAAGVTGVFLVLGKRALVSDAVSHATLPGIGLAFIAMVMAGVTGAHCRGCCLARRLRRGWGCSASAG